MYFITQTRDDFKKELAMVLPKAANSLETMIAKVEAVDMVDGLIKRNLELEDIYAVLQPLLFELSTKLYTSDEPVSLDKMVSDGIRFIKGEEYESRKD